MTGESNTPMSPHAARDAAMGWLIRYSGSGLSDAVHADELIMYVNRLRDENNWLREIHKSDVAELQAKLFAARQAAFSEGLRASEPHLPLARGREFS